MATVHFGLEQQRFTKGVTEIDIDAPNVSQLIAKLDAKFPGLGPLLESSAVAIDGEVINDPAYERVPEGAEIYFVVKAAGGSFWSVYHGDVDAAKVKEAQSLGLKVLVWTVNDAPTMGRMLDLGVDGLITDRPDIARKVFAARGIVPK